MQVFSITLSRKSQNKVKKIKSLLLIRKLFAKWERKENGEKMIVTIQLTTIKLDLIATNFASLP